MESPQPGVADHEVREALSRHYRLLAAEYAGSPHRCWDDRLAAAVDGDTLIEPGWLLRRIVGDQVDVYGLYRVYSDGRIERDRFLEHAERERFRSGSAADVVRSAVSAARPRQA
jgi:hypothetical protein